MTFYPHFYPFTDKKHKLCRFFITGHGFQFIGWEGKSQGRILNLFALRTGEAAPYAFQIPLALTHRTNSIIMRNMKHHFLPLFLIVAISTVLYSNTLNNGFVYDDENTIVKNILVKDFRNLPELFEMDYFAQSGENSYRPIVTFTYFLDYALYGLSPWGFHLTNLLLHAINGILLYIFAMLLIQQPMRSGNRSKYLFDNQPLLISLLFVTHPVLTEAVNAISFREDLLAFLFYIATLSIYIRLRTNIFIARKPLLYTVSCTLYFLALLSKEMALTLLLIVYIYEWIYAEKKRGFLSIFNSYNIGFIFVTFAYIYLRFYYFINPAEKDIARWMITERLLTAPGLFLNYLKLILFPLNLSADYRIEPVNSLSSPLFILPLITMSSFLIIALILRKKRKDAAFGILFFILTLIPVSNIIPIHNPLAERYLYLPIVGFIIMVGTTIYLISRFRLIFTIFLLIILSVYSVGVAKRNKVWENNYSLWSDTLKKIRHSTRAHINLGLAYYSIGELEKAVLEYKDAIKVDPYEPSTHYNLGNVYFKMGLFEEAIKEYKTSIMLNSDYTDAHYNLGSLYAKMGKFENAIGEYKIVIKLKPDHPDIHNDIGNAYLKKGQLKEAIQEFQIALRLRPTYFTYYDLGTAYAKHGRYEEAIPNFQTALTLKSDSAEAHYNLGVAYFNKGFLDKARLEFEITLTLQSDFPPARQAIESLNKRGKL